MANFSIASCAIWSPFFVCWYNSTVKSWLITHTVTYSWLKPEIKRCWRRFFSLCLWISIRNPQTLTIFPFSFKTGFPIARYQRYCLSLFWRRYSTSYVAVESLVSWMFLSSSLTTSISWGCIWFQSIENEMCVSPLNP